MKKPVFFLSLVMLSGCASVGMNLDESHMRVVAPSGQQLAADPVYDVIPITAAVVSQQHVSEQRQDAHPYDNPAMHQAIQDYHYHIQPSDVLNITVFDHPELVSQAASNLSTEESGIMVTKAGTIFYPYAGVVPVAGKTAEEVRALLTQRLARYLRNPQVQVRVAGYRSQHVDVSGEVKKPGVLPITDTPLTVMEAINRSDGPTADADMSDVVVTHGNITTHLDLQNLQDKGDRSQNRLLQTGDVVTVGDIRRKKVYIMGEVTKQAALVMNKGHVSLAEALGEAGGLNLSYADARRIYVIRGNLDHPTIYKLDGNAPDAMLLASSFQLQPKDIVYVATANIGRWGRTISNLSPALNWLPLIRLP